MALDADHVGQAQDWYLRFLDTDRSKPAVLKEFTLTQLVSQDISFQIDSTCDIRPSHVPGGLVLGRLSRKTKDDVNTGLFSAPVLSRNHAKISVNHIGQVFIVDLDSRHGTYIKTGVDTHKLPPFTPFQLVEGDVLVLGTRIHSSKEEHAPVQVRVSFKYTLAGLANSGGDRTLPSSLHTCASIYDRAAILFHVNPTTSPSEMIDLSEESPPMQGNSNINPITVFDESESLHIAKDDVATVHDVPGSTKTRRGYGLSESVLYATDDDEELPRGTVSASPETFAPNEAITPLQTEQHQDELVKLSIDVFGVQSECAAKESVQMEAQEPSFQEIVTAEAFVESHPDEIGPTAEDKEAIPLTHVRDVDVVHLIVDLPDLNDSSDMEVEDEDEDEDFAEDEDFVEDEDFHEEEDFNEDASEDGEDDYNADDDGPEEGWFSRLKYADVFVDSEDYYSDEDDNCSESHECEPVQNFLLVRPTIAAITHENEVGQAAVQSADDFPEFSLAQILEAPEPIAAAPEDACVEDEATAPRPINMDEDLNDYDEVADDNVDDVQAFVGESFNEDEKEDQKDDYLDYEEHGDDENGDGESHFARSNVAEDGRSQSADEYEQPLDHGLETKPAVWAALRAESIRRSESVSRATPGIVTAPVVDHARDHTPELSVGSDVSSDGPATPGTPVDEIKPIISLKRKRDDDDIAVQLGHEQEGPSPSKMAKTQAASSLWPVTAAFALGTLVGGAGTIVGLMQYGA